MAPTATTTTKTAPSKTKAANGSGVKKAPGGRKGGKNANAKNAMVKMQAYFKAHRHEFKDLPFKEQQKELGKKWKTAPENPKVSA
ncbi:uncharacterized protein EI97DRAFT_429829 [Westerdykella ornata]|uniref:Uncharacterized protein n=1 Tax=Westerdykella ornata TaxID=318751 RepID=A0A6A6JYF7_WESOR|nr:uncharacterized protein EI97DRAFT_429829 [Westerdykella ornata]KAF2280069.1 hypothetical protein EI97DRAFT_429829 [Westerdykella ornata]